MKILYLSLDWGIPILGYKGASVHVREFVSALSSLGHEVVIVTANIGSGNPPPPAKLVELPAEIDITMRHLEADRIRMPYNDEDIVLRRELDKIIYDRTAAKRSEVALRELGFAPDFIYERHALFHCAGVDLAERLKVPRILELNAPLIDEQRRYRGLRLEAEATAMEHRSFKGARHICTVSESLKKYVEEIGVESTAVTCLPNGVDTGRFRPDIDPTPVRNRHGIGNRPVIGFVGSLKPWHGLDNLFEAFQMIDRSKVDPVLMIVGDGPGFEAAKEMSTRNGLLGRVVVVGKIRHDEVPSYLAAMTVSAAPYRLSDDFYFSPLKVVESLACGCPVVAPDQGQLRDLIEHGVTGYLYPPDDLEGLADRLTRILVDAALRDKMAHHGRLAAERRFSWSQIVRHAVQIGQQHCSDG